MDFEDDCEVLDDDVSDEEAMQQVEEDQQYDAAADENDENWVKKHFLKIDVSTRQSDAVLNCPACFTLVCFDCQKHEVYEQYRAMFVKNCCVYTNRIVKPINAANTKDIYNPVHCNECKLEIGARDQEEVIHFYHVIASR